MEKGTSEIAKLTERIAKDPKSKLFVPLAEEYKKIGEIEMAIAVLTEGLKNNPGYVTAKSFLGRLLLDKGNLSEAQKEFEEVIKAIPDNVLAQRKLGDIHALQGRAQEALVFFKAVLTVNPKDPELKALVADIEAGRDVRGKIVGPKYQSAVGQVAAAVPTPLIPQAAPLPPVKPPAVSVVPPRPQAAPVSISPSVDEEEPEEVLVFESLDEAAPAEVLLQPEATQDMLDIFAESTSETGSEEAVRLDDGLTGGENRRLAETELSSEPQPVSGSDAGMMPAPDRSAAEVTERESGPTAGSGNSFFDSEFAPIDIPVADNGGFDAAVAPDLFTAVTDHELGPTDAGLTASSFFDSETMQAEPQKTADILDFTSEPAREVPVGELTGIASADDSSSEALFFDVEPVEEAQLSAQVSGNGPDVAANDGAASFGETLPDADDFTTDTLAELYIAQGFYEKAIEIYERMLADRPNSKLLKDKLANVHAMGSASSADEEQGTPVLFEAPGSPPVPSPQSLSADGAKQWNVPGVEAEAKEYIPPVADDFESAVFDTGFAPVEYVQPEAPGTEPQQELPVQDGEPLPAEQKTAFSGKELTIAKLDNWLKNIMKEK